LVILSGARATAAGIHHFVGAEHVRDTKIPIAGAVKYSGRVLELSHIRLIILYF